MFKRLAFSVAEPLRLILTRSYEEGVVPVSFKHSIVTPVHKKGPKSNVDNFRPVAQESVPCLILEKLLVDHMKITSDGAYLRHGGKPVVAVWGIGFSDRRQYTLDESIEDTAMTLPYLAG